MPDNGGEQSVLVDDEEYVLSCMPIMCVCKTFLIINAILLCYIILNESQNIHQKVKLVHGQFFTYKRIVDTISYPI